MQEWVFSCPKRELAEAKDQLWLIKYKTYKIQETEATSGEGTVVSKNSLRRHSGGPSGTGTRGLLSGRQRKASSFQAAGGKLEAVVGGVSSWPAGPELPPEGAVMELTRRARHCRMAGPGRNQNSSS